MSIFHQFQSRFDNTGSEDMSLQDYLELCKRDPTAYASVAERMLMAIGEPELVDTRLQERYSRISMIRAFHNQVNRA